MILQQKNQNQNYHRYKNNEQEMQQINQVGLLYILIILLIQIIIHNKEGAPCPLKSWNTVSLPTRRDARRAAEQSAMSGTGMTQEMETLAFEDDSQAEELTLEEAEEGARLYDQAQAQVVLQLEPHDQNA